MANKDNTQVWKKRLERATLFVAVAAVIFAALQWYEMRHALLVDQRAWVNVVVPTNFPLEGAFIAVPIQIANTGKTPAKYVEGDLIATLLKKGEEPSFDFSIGHPHNRIYAGAVFPNAPLNTALSVVRYGPFTQEAIVPTPELRQEIGNGESFIIFYGKVTYSDVFGATHWTTFCTGTGVAIQTIDLKKCVNYNDVDSN
jgi:hypothetical protein